MRTFSMCLLLWGLGGCSNEAPSITNRVPAIAVAPGEVDFDEVALGLSTTLPLYLSNPGGADLVGQMSFEGFEGEFSIDQGTGFEVAPNQELVLDLRFTPGTFRDYATNLRIDSNDPETPVETISIRGVGADLPLPDIRVEPGLTLETFDKPGGQPALVLVNLINEGGAPLTVSELRLEGSTAFSLASSFEPTRLAAQNSMSVLVQYEAPDVDGHFADLFVMSDDPDESEVQVRILGNGGGPDLELPVAVIDCPAVVELNGPERTTISGEKSFDPDGLEPLTYQWRVTQRPDASDDAIELDPDDAESIDLYVDVAGSWEVELVVANSLETSSEPTLCSFEAIPEDDLRVELSWNTAAADIDLHLLRNGADLFDPEQDCHYCNPNPDWGTSAQTDDPRLDIDDRSGFGPENINIESPENTTYDVRVHYFKTNGDKAVTATVLVWMGGKLAWQGQRVLANRNDVWEVGTVDIGANSFDPGTSPNAPATTVGCE